MKFYGVVDAERAQVGKARNLLIARRAVHIQSSLGQQFCQLGSILPGCAEDKSRVCSRLHETFLLLRSCGSAMAAYRDVAMAITSAVPQIVILVTRAFGAHQNEANFPLIIKPCTEGPPPKPFYRLPSNLHTKRTEMEASIAFRRSTSTRKCIRGQSYTSLRATLGRFGNKARQEGCDNFARDHGVFT